MNQPVVAQLSVAAIRSSRPGTAGCRWSRSAWVGRVGQREVLGANHNFHGLVDRYRRRHIQIDAPEGHLKSAIILPGKILLSNEVGDKMVDGLVINVDGEPLWTSPTHMTKIHRSWRGLLPGRESRIKR